MKPPPLAALARGQTSPKQNRVDALTKTASAFRWIAGAVVRQKPSNEGFRLNSDTASPAPYCYELQVDRHLEKPPTCTPPPICMSALGSQTALI
jgi:hypothetical protein